MEMDSDLKSSGRFFQDCAQVSQLKEVKTDLASFFFSSKVAMSLPL